METSKSDRMPLLPTAEEFGRALARVAFERRLRNGQLKVVDDNEKLRYVSGNREPTEVKE